MATKKKNSQDLILRNLRALKKRNEAIGNWQRTLENWQRTLVKKYLLDGTALDVKPSAKAKRGKK